MIAWRTLACSGVALCLSILAPGCGDDGSITSGLSGANGGGSGTDSSSSDSSGSGGSSESSGSGSSSGNSTDPTTGSGTSTTTNTTNTTLPPQTTGDLTTGMDTTTTGQTTMNTTNPAGCGNNNIDPNEQCDGANLNGFTCESLGNAGGTLACDPVTCTFDTSMCMGNGSGTSG